MDPFVAIGEIVNAVGLRGEVKLYPLLDFHEPLLDSGFLVWQDGTPARVRRHRPTGGGCLALVTDGCDDRDGAEALVGRELGFLRTSYLDPDFPRPAQGLAFRYLGRRVVAPDGQVIGSVDEVRRAGAQLLLVVPDGAGEILIPAVAPILRPDDGLEGDLVVDAPEGLLDANRE
ncbi:MAG: ribosome maturation factor RimM [Candidatus Krumholzibacteriia bacterium]